MVLAQLGMKVFYLIFYYLRITKAGLIDDIHALLENVWVRRVAHLEDGFLFNAKDAIVDVEIGNEEVKHVGARAFLETARQSEQSQSKQARNPLLPYHLVLHFPLQLTLVLINFFIISLSEEYFSGKLV